VAAAHAADVNETDIDRESEEWKQARTRVTARRDFGSHVVAFVVVNAFFVLVWVLTGAGYFWPAWIIGFWGIGLVLHAWETFVRKPVTDADVERELHRDKR
jgi:fatty acid desaturase